MAEILKIREITIDTMQHKDFNVKEEELKLIRFYQNDLNSAKLLINVTHDKVVTDFSSATSVQIAFLKPDCKRVFQDVQNVNQMQGKYYVVLSTQTLIAYGNVIAQLRFTFPNSKVIETCKFAFTVDESIMSDETMKSTNEFPVIQKAIEAGKKLEGVDIDGIIAAGELAKGAVKKTGDTMTGDLNFDTTSTLKRISSYNGNTKVSSLAFAKTGAIFLEDGLRNNFNPWVYDSGTQTFTVNTNTNLLKKTGDTMTDKLNFTGSAKGIAWVAGGVEEADLIHNNRQVFFRGKPSTGVTNNAVIYNVDTDTLNVNANTNLLKKSGDTMTGSFKVNNQVNINTADENQGVILTSNASRFAIAPSPKGVTDWTKEIALEYATGKLTVSSLATKKDGRADLTLTADATHPDINNPMRSTRRGNTVTTSGTVIINAGATGTIITTLPVDMRPVNNISTYVPSTDGTVVVQVFINASTGVMALSTNAKGKRIEFVVTYVVN
ncbi:BppU family phage baseplate upper protein [Bacillus cereus]|uniref:BppU family phage baseplate upper protein n=1 Tax=Bacillus cereus TaxID=1396 RepID=UPI001D0D720C